MDGNLPLPARNGAPYRPFPWIGKEERFGFGGPSLALIGLNEALLASSDIAAGLGVMVLGALALEPRYAWARWAAAAKGMWAMLAASSSGRPTGIGVPQRYAGRRLLPSPLELRQGPVATGGGKRLQDSAGLDYRRLAFRVTGEHRRASFAAGRTPLGHSMTEVSRTADVDAENFTDDLSDEALIGSTMTADFSAGFSRPDSPVGRQPRPKLLAVGDR